MKYPEGVSLITCTYNGADRLPETIKHIAMQEADPAIPWELLVVDNASEDNSGEVARGSWTLDPDRLRVIVENKKGVAHARHRGVREARYEFISFVDDDNWICPGWVQQVHEILKGKPGVGICVGRNIGAFESEPPEWFESVQGAYAIGQPQEHTGDITNTSKNLWGAGMSFRKSAFERLTQSGFRSELVGRKGKALTAGEDTEMAFAFQLAGWQFWYDDALELEHFIPRSRLNWDYVVRLYEGFGKSDTIFDIYRLVIRDKPYSPFKYYKKLYRNFSDCKEKIKNGTLEPGPGNREYLKYSFNKAKLEQALRNVHKYGRLFKRLQKLKNTLNTPL